MSAQWLTSVDQTISFRTGSDSPMNTNKLLVAAILAAAIGAPIAGFVSEMKGQPMTSTGVRVPFLHGIPNRPVCQSKRAGVA